MVEFSNSLNESVSGELKTRYVNRLEPRISKLAKLLNYCEQSHLSDEHRQELLMQAHQLAGNGGTFGYYELSSLGAKLEEALSHNVEMEIENVTRLTQQLLKMCRIIVGKESSEVSPAKSLAGLQAVSSIQARSVFGKILIADDDASVRDILKQQFEAEGYEVVCARDGGEAWTMLQRDAINLAVLDRKMPVYGGMTVLCMMQEHSRLKDLPVVFLTSRKYGSEVLEGFKNGAADYITKPFDPKTVIERCENLLNICDAQPAHA